MWKLEVRGARGTPFEELGSFASIAEAAEAIQKIEQDDFWIFFRVAVNALDEKPASDAEVLSHLSYQSRTRYYALTRSTQ